MKNLNDAAITLNRLMSQAKTDQQKKRALQYRTIYLDKLAEANETTFSKDALRLIGLTALACIGVVVTLFFVSQGWLV